MKNRLRIKALAAVALTPLAPKVLAQSAYPNRPITVIVPYPAGGQTDVEVRSLCNIASKLLGQSIVVQNKAGANGTLGAQALASAPPDGYLLSNIPVSVYRQPFMVKTTYEPLRDLSYVIGTSGYTMGFVVRADSPWKTLQELWDYAKAHPGKLRYASPGVGSGQHTTTETIAAKLGLEMLHVPFKGTAENNIALQGGHVDFNADGSGWASLVDSGKFRLLATWGAEPSKRWPTVPTLKSLGYGIVQESPYGFAGPKNLPEPIVARLHAAFKQALYSPEHQQVLNQLAQPTSYMSPDQFRKYAAEESVRQEATVKRFNLGQS